MSLLMKSPRWVVFQLLEACNLRCKMCYEWGEHGSYLDKKEKHALDIDVVNRVIDETAPYKPYYGLFGGEPLMYPDVWDVISRVKSHGCGIDIPTNGTLIEKNAELLMETAPDRLWISLDGPEEVNDAQRGTGVYQKVMKGIERLHELRGKHKSDFPKFGVTFIVTPQTHTYIEEVFTRCLTPDMIDHLSIEFQNFTTRDRFEAYEKIVTEDFGMPGAPAAEGYVQNPEPFANIDFELVTNQILKVKEDYEEKGKYVVCYPKTTEKTNVTNYFTANWEQMTDWHPTCPFPLLYAEVAANGNVTTCHTYYDIPIGNVNNESILDMWKGPVIKKLRKHLRKNGLFPICTACPRFYADPSKR